jgi:hypothetical protein
VSKNEDGKLCNYMYGEFKTHFGMEHCNTKIPSSIWKFLQDCIYHVSAHLLIEVDNDKKTFMCAVNEVWCDISFDHLSS